MNFLIVNCSRQENDYLKFLETNLRNLKYDMILFNLKELLFDDKLNKRFKKIKDRLHLKIMDDNYWGLYAEKIFIKEGLKLNSIDEIIDYYYTIGKKKGNYVTENPNEILCIISCEILTITQCVDMSIDYLKYCNNVIIFDCYYLILKKIEALLYGNYDITCICGQINDQNSGISTMLVKFTSSAIIDFVGKKENHEIDEYIFTDCKNILLLYSDYDYLHRFSDKGIFPLIETYLNGELMVDYDISSNIIQTKYIGMNDKSTYCDSKYKVNNKTICRLKRNLSFHDLKIDLYCFYMKRLIQGFKKRNYIQNRDNKINRDNASYSQNKYLTIYCYYEKSGYTKNQTNLQHFINNGLSIPNMDYIFNINGHKCSIDIPFNDNIRIFSRNNCTDFEGWYHCLTDIEWESYEYIFFINCSVLGPLNLDNSNNITKDWFTPFLEKMDSETTLCSNVIIEFNSTHLSGGGKKCTSYCFLLDTRMIPMLLTQRTLIGNYYNTVFGKKKDRLDAILTGEFCLSKVILDMGYKITCLHPDYSDRSSHDSTILNRKPTIPMTLFMKNNWIDGDTRACPPVGYMRCMEIIGKRIREPPKDFNKLRCPNTGICYTNRQFDWKNKKEFYEKFGYSEEIEF